MRQNWLLVLAALVAISMVSGAANQVMAGEVNMGRFELVSAYCTPTSDSVRWVTYYEIETLYVYLDVSFDCGMTWQLGVIRKDGRGNYPATTNYGCRYNVDKFLYNNIWYRLRWVFYNGTEYIGPNYLISKGSLPTGIEKEHSQPNGYVLAQNYPNPFNPVTTIEFSIPMSGYVRLVIYDLLGREIRTLINNRLAPGKHTTLWDGTNSAGLQVASGTYIYSLVANGLVHTKRLVFTK